jgi:hypothetical protein
MLKGCIAVLGVAVLLGCEGHRHSFSDEQVDLAFRQRDSISVGIAQVLKEQKDEIQKLKVKVAKLEREKK